MPKRLKLSEGDLFKFAADETHCGVGQIIEFVGGSKSSFLTTILEPLYPADVGIDDVDTQAILLCGKTFDALLFHKRWTIFGNVEPPVSRVPKPHSIVTMQDGTWLQDFADRPIRPATLLEAQNLDLSSTRAPIGYQNAFLAHHGLGEWKESFDRLRYTYQQLQADVVS